MISDCCPHLVRFPEQEKLLRIQEQKQRGKSELNDITSLWFNNMQMNTGCSFTVSLVYIQPKHSHSTLFPLFQALFESLFLLYALIYKCIHFSCFLLQTSVCLLNFLYTSCCDYASQTLCCRLMYYFLLPSSYLRVPCASTPFFYLFLQ